MTITLNQPTQLLFLWIAIGVSLIILALATLVVVLFRKVNKKATREDLEGHVNLLRKESKTGIKKLDTKTQDHVDSLWEYIHQMDKSMKGCVAKYNDNFKNIQRDFTSAAENFKKLDIAHNKLSAQLFNVEQLEILNSQNIRRLQNVVPEVKQEVSPETENEEVYLKVPMGEMLEIAKNKYSIGDEVRCDFVGSAYSGILDEEPKIQKHMIIAKMKQSQLNMIIYSSRSNKWAEIISKPITEPIKEEVFPTELNAWLEYVKAKNLSLEELETILRFGETCHFANIYEKLKGGKRSGKAKILYDLWNQEPTDEQLLEKAKRDYPIGTRIRSLVNEEYLATITGVPYKGEQDGFIRTDAIKEDGGKCNWYIFHNKKWAEIIPAEVAEPSREIKPEKSKKLKNIHYHLPTFNNDFVTACGLYNKKHKFNLSATSLTEKVTCKNCLKVCNKN